MVYQGGMLTLLGKGDLDQIHNTSLKILEEVGMEVENEKILTFLQKKEAVVDTDTSVVRISPAMVEEAIDSAPSEVTLYSRDGSRDLHLGGTRVYIGTGGTAVNVLDLETGERREATAQDLINTARLVEELENIDFYVIPTFPHDYPKSRADEARFFHALAYTNKHVMGGVYTLEGIKRVIDFAVEVAGSKERLHEKPFLSMITSIMSPLKMEREYTQLMQYIVEAGVPIVAPPAPIAGATSPLTLAGTLAQMNAEALFGVVLTQLIKPGAKVLYGVVPTTMDMKTSNFRFSSIEMGMMNAAAAQLAQRYNLPIYNTAGVTDSKVPDVEAGYEKISNILLCALTGSNYIHDAAGLLDTGLSVAYEQYVIDNEILGLVKRVLRGIEVDEERLALDDVADVGPGGNYLTAASTLKHMKSELYEDRLYDPKNYQEWQRDGAPDARERARRIARDILAAEERICLSEQEMKRVKAL